MGHVIAVDLGHLYSCMVALRESEDKPRVITFANSTGYTTDALPTVVAYPRVGRPRAGEPLLAWLARDPSRTLYGFKRLLGRSYEDVQTQSAISGLSWNAVADSNGGIAARLDDATPLVPLGNVAVELFCYLYEAASTFVRGKIDQAVITVPACFATSQAEAIAVAARAAGWPELHICREPVALADRLARLEIFEGQLAALCDLGGGKFEVCVVEFGARGEFRLLATCGESLLGGADLDSRIVDALVEELSEQIGLDLKYDILVRLRVQAELSAARPALYRQGQVELHLPFISLKRDKSPAHAKIILTRERHDGLIADLLVHIERACARVLDLAGIDRWDTRGNVWATGGYATLRAYERAVDRGLGTPRFLPRKHLIAYGSALLARYKVGNMELGSELAGDGCETDI